MEQGESQRSEIFVYLVKLYENSVKSSVLHIAGVHGPDGGEPVHIH